MDEILVAPMCYLYFALVLQLCIRVTTLHLCYMKNACNFFMFIISELIIYIQIKTEQNSSLGLYNMTWAIPKQGAKVCKGQHMGVRGEDREHQATGESNEEYQQGETIPCRCTQSEDEPEKNLSHFCFIFEYHQPASLIHKLHLTCVFHHLYCHLQTNTIFEVIIYIKKLCTSDQLKTSVF